MAANRCRGAGSARFPNGPGTPQPEHDHRRRTSATGHPACGRCRFSVGHVIAHTLAAQGLCGELRLADFDRIELSTSIGYPPQSWISGATKPEVAARRIAELDPYLRLRALEAGLTSGNVDEFLNGLDIVIEECDSLDIKALLRESARARGIPVLMATSDRGLVDVERFDLEPQRPILHGLLGDVDLRGSPA